MNLTSTVTKGIVSAKARKIQLGRSKMSVDAFIQTDAAVNPGSSGGALVNLRGELVGINTAMAVTSTSQNFLGHSFAVPSSIVQKVTSDLRKHGAVQRAMLGITMCNVDADLAAKEKLHGVSGVYVAEIIPGAAAAEAGFQKGDVIVEINGTAVKNMSQLQERIARDRPQDKVTVTFYRGNSKKTVVVTLREQEEQVICQADLVKLRGATFRNIVPKVRKQYKIRGGVRIQRVQAGPWQKAGLKAGFRITAMNKEPVKDIGKLADIFNQCTGVILVEGLHPNGTAGYYAVDLGGR